MLTASIQCLSPHFTGQYSRHYIACSVWQYSHRPMIVNSIYISMIRRLFSILAITSLIQKSSWKAFNVSFSLWYLKCVYMIFRNCAFILFIIVSCGISGLSYLWLFLEVQISYNIIYWIVS